MSKKITLSLTVFSIFLLVVLLTFAPRASFAQSGAGPSIGDPNSADSLQNPAGTTAITKACPECGVQIDISQTEKFNCTKSAAACIKSKTSSKGAYPDTSHSNEQVK